MDEFESVVVWWMNLHSYRVNEVSYKVKNKYSILKHICRIFAGKEWRHRWKEWTCGHNGGRKEWGKWRK